MPLKLDPYISPLDDYMHNFKLIHDYFSTNNCDYQIECSEGFNWKQEKLEEIVINVCDMLDIEPNKVKIFTDGIYSTNSGIEFISKTPEKFLYLFADAMQNNYFAKTHSHHFLSMTNRPTWDRLSIASFLYKYFEDKSKIKFPLHEQYTHYSIGIDTAYANYVDHSEYKKQILNFLSKVPIDDIKESWTREDLLNTMQNKSQFHSYELYQKIAVEIVNETNITSGFFCTEKIVRPIAYYTPFVVMAVPNFLKHLQTLGFKTFDTLWDESYDEYKGKQRLEKIYETLNEIAKIDLKTLHKQTHDICVYNKSVLDSYQWKNKFKDIKV
tara:strand:- start:275 stop:1252 length:978 start_codon:yes stop_codon:yes gene_type:complete